VILKPRPGFEAPVAVIDAVNPALVILSIVGLFFEFTPLKRWAIPVNQVIDVLFVVDFVIRLICFPTGRYLFKGYGWIDFLASLPGLTLLLAYTPVFGAFKFIRIGRFFKIIRVLRFLRVFSFLKRMRSDSVYIQDRIMKIGISIVLVFIVGIFAAETLSTLFLEDLKAAPYHDQYRTPGATVESLAAAHPEVLFYTTAGKIFERKAASFQPGQAKTYDEAANDADLRLEIPLQSETITTADGIRYPVEGLLIAASDVMAAHDALMLVLISTLVVLLLFLMFYVGFLFAKDMKVVQLINDSIDADDYLLLNEEAKGRRNSGGDLVVEEGEDEIESLLKMVGRLTLAKAEEASSLDSTGLRSGFGGLEARLDRIEALAEAQDGRMLTQKQLVAIIRETINETLRTLKKKEMP
jgi:hypothetical protein